MTSTNITIQPLPSPPAIPLTNTQTGPSHYNQDLQYVGAHAHYLLKHLETRMLS